MRTIHTSTIYAALKELILKTLTSTTREAITALKSAQENEECEASKYALEIILKNIEIAKKTARPLCQDTGMAVVFLAVGQNVCFSGEFIEDTINRAVADAYKEGCFRMSVLSPLTRINTKNNTPAVIHYEIIKGDKIHIQFLPKGFGSENMTKTYMLTPDKGKQGVVDSILDAVEKAGSSPCPPVVIGVGIGGTLDKCAYLSKKALLRPVSEPHSDPEIATLESEILSKVNTLGIGVQGYGGANTALAVHIETFPTHIAGLPVCVSLQCHSIRQGEITL